MKIKVYCDKTELAEMFPDHSRKGAPDHSTFKIGFVEKAFELVGTEHGFSGFVLTYQELVKLQTPQEVAAQAAVKSAEDTLKKAKETLNKIQENK